MGLLSVRPVEVLLRRLLAHRLRPALACELPVQGLK